MKRYLNFREFLKMEAQDLYPSRWSVGGAFIANLISLTIYWFTSKAFSTSVESLVGSLGLDYFHFILVGEIMLMIPIVLVEGVSQSIRQSVANGTIETFLMLPVSFEKPFILWMSAKGLLEFFRLIILVGAAVLIFNFQLDLFAIIKFLAILIVTAPLFLALGIFAASILIQFGRGEKAITFIVNLMTIFSGLYFPITVLPETLHKIISASSPFYLVMDQSRRALSHQPTLSLVSWLMIFVFGYLLLKLSVAVFNLSFKRASFNAKPFLFRF